MVLLLEQIDHFECAGVDGNILDCSVVLVGGSVDLEGEHPGGGPFAVEDEFEEGDVAVEFVEDSALVQGIEQFLQLLEFCGEGLLVQLLEPLEATEDVLDAIDLGVGVLLHGFFQPSLVLQGHLLELRLLRPVRVLQ